MEYRFEHIDEKQIVGMNFYGNPFDVGGAWSVDNAIGKLWQRFSKYLSRRNMIRHRMDSETSYECHIMGDDFEDSGEYGIMVGVEVKTVMGQPVDLVAKNLPGGEYLILTLNGEEIVSDHCQYIDDILKTYPDKKADTSFFIEKYDRRFKGMDCISESVIEILIPLKTVKVQ